MVASKQIKFTTHQITPKYKDLIKFCEKVWSEDFWNRVKDFEDTETVWQQCSNQQRNNLNNIENKNKNKMKWDLNKWQRIITIIK